jgi:tetratricopeptide (TPR) repeat protein
MEIRDRLLGAEHPETISCRHKLADALASAGKVAEAEKEYRAVLAMRERAQGPNYYETVTARRSLAGVLMSEDKYEEAEKELRERLCADEQTHGPDDRQTLETCLDLAGCLDREKKGREALALYRRSEAGLIKLGGWPTAYQGIAADGRARWEAALGEK